MAGSITIGQLVGFLFYLGLFYEPIARLHGLNQMVQAARAAGERVFDILDAPVERADRHSDLITSGNGDAASVFAPPVTLSANSRPSALTSVAPHLREP